MKSIKQIMFFLFVVSNQLNGQYTIKPNECNKGKEMVKESSKEPTFHFLPLFNELEERLPTSDGNNRNDKPANIYLPDENGEAIEFSLTLSPVLSPEMQAAYPDFKTYTLAHAANARMAGRIFVSRYGWEGMAIINGKRIKYEPLDRSNPTLHQCFEWKEKTEYSCQAEIMPDADAETGTSNKNTTISAQPNGYIRRTYDLAIVTTGEFYQHASFGNNNPTQALAAVVNIVNLLNITYNAELSIHFNLANTPYFYTNPTTDIFSSTTSNLLTQAATALAANFTSNSYDVGHVFHATTSGGIGIAQMDAVCKTAQTGTLHPKSKGWSGGNSINKLALDILLHEMGHQLGALHTFNGTGSNCTAQVSASDAVEIGSGTTLMSYLGNCQASNNINAAQDYTFHARSLETIFAYLEGEGGTCASTSPTLNTPPVVNANPCNGNYTIPKLTPFSIYGTATDTETVPSGLTYTWQQMDEDGANSPTQGFLDTIAGNSSLAPIFRSYYPSTQGNTRVFPQLSTILNAANASTFEPLPNAARTLHLRLTARDNNPNNGATGYGDLAITVHGSAGPLQVTSPNTAAITWNIGAQTVTWQVNNTQILFSTVDILLSVDGGASFPYTLLTNTPNDGTHTVTVPQVPNTTQARIKIRYRPNTCFEIFDISDTNFTITSPCQVKANRICTDTPLSCNSCSDQLQLQLQKMYIDAETNTISGTMATTDPITARAVFSTQGGTSCQSIDTRRMKTYKFMVSSAGSYLFTVNSAVFTAFSVFTGFNASSPCASTAIVGSNGFISTTGTVNVYTSAPMYLSPCIEYTIAIWQTTTGTPSFNITASGANALLMIGAAPPQNYNAYTYLATQQYNQLILKHDPNSDFRNIEGGNFSVQGINYQTGLNPNAWVGQNIYSVISSNCAILSSTAKQISVTKCFANAVTLLRKQNKTYSKLKNK